MKKTALALLLAFAAIHGQAQNAYDALTFSESNYEGTARSVAMGNAFTALGGDLGGVTINPAGSAVGKYSQFTITPALTISTATTQGVPPVEGGSLTYFERQIKSSLTRMTLPNFGMTTYWETGRKSGLKSMTMGFIVNTVNTWNEDVFANGHNERTSFAGSLAAGTTTLMAELNETLPAGEKPYTSDDLTNDESYDYMPWRDVVGFNSYITHLYPGMKDVFIGANEIAYDNGDIALGGQIEQTYGRRVQGSRQEYLFNLGGNVSDMLYFGVNLGINSISYNYMDYFKEEAVNEEDFLIRYQDGTSTYWKSLKYNYDYNAQGTGVFLKAGFILTPGGGFRIGAAIQTPTANTIEEEWQESGQTKYSTAKYDAKATSPLGYGTYSFKAPYKANFGVAYTFGQFGVISADYELCDYSTMRYSSEEGDDDYFEGVNLDIKKRFGTSHMLRTGIEIRPLGSLAIRAGYGLTTAAELYDDEGNELGIKPIHNASFGIGYSSKGSFFADAAVKTTFRRVEYYMPYDDYMYDESGNISIDDFVPEISIIHSNWKALITFGWRF